MDAAEQSLSTESRRDEQSREKEIESIEKSVANLKLENENSREREKEEKNKDSSVHSLQGKDLVASSSDNKKSSETTIDTARTEETAEAANEEYLYDPYPNANEPLSDIDDEDLLLMLQSLQVDDEDSSDDPFDPIPLEDDVLEDLEVDSDQQEILPLQDFSNVFGENNVVSPEADQTRRSVPQGQDETEDFDDEDGEAPWYLICRPCQPNMEDPISIQYGLFQQLSEEEQLQLSLQAMADDNHILDGGVESKYSEDEQVYEDSFQSFIVSRRREAVAAAISYTRAFGTGLYQPPLENENPANERTCFGHKETIYCVQFSECGKYLASASQDATVCVWNVATNSLLSTLTGHSKEFECLRVAWAPTNWSASSGEKNANGSFVASGGADGTVKIWLSSDPSKRDSWECVSTLDHGSFAGRRTAASSEDKDDVPQIYALQFIEHWQGLASASGAGPREKNSFLMTSSDDYIHLWDMEVRHTDEKTKFCFSEVFSIRFTRAENLGGGVSVCNVTSAGLKVPHDESSTNNAGSSGHRFGGARNPNNLCYVFDASYCPGNGLLGVALSDGTMRLVNGRGVCVSFLSLPGLHAHLTSFTWDSTGSRLASCVGSGQLILWRLHNEDENGKTSVSCVAVLEGGHRPGTPVFGARYCGVDNEDLIVSWGVDGRLCLWDSESHGQIHAPISTLVSRLDYPIYAVDIATSKDAGESIVSRLAVGGGRDAGFIGVPLYMHNVERMSLGSTKSEEEPATTAFNETTGG